MNKQKGIIIGILALAVTMMVGYALFSETITINGTATAKGSFDMTITCEPGLTNGITVNDIPYTKQDNNYKNDSCNVDGNTVSYDVELTQPGAARNFTIKIENTGSIPATWDGNTDEKRTSCKGDYLTGTFEECVDGSAAIDNMISELNMIAISDGTKMYKISEASDEELQQFADQSAKVFVLEPGESIYFVGRTEWGYLGSAIDGSKKVLFKENITTKFNFNQKTN